jgi:hypothetical protein
MELRAADAARNVCDSTCAEGLEATNRFEWRSASANDIEFSGERSESAVTSG